MKAFSQLYTTLDATTSTRDKLDALTAYFRSTPAADAAWAAYFLAGGKPRQLIPTRLMRELAQTLAGLPEWLFEESYQSVGDLAETIAHILPPATRETSLGLAAWIEERLLPLRGASPDVLSAALTDYWDELDWSGRFLLTKLIGGGFRVGVSRQLVVRSLGEVAGVDHKRIAHRMVGWTDARRAPTAARFLKLIAAGEPSQATAVHGALDTDDNTATASVNVNAADASDAAIVAPPRVEGADASTRLFDDPPEPIDADDVGLPYPFFLAHPLPNEADAYRTLGELTDWQAEWKWDGIRAQLVKRAGDVWIWSRGEDLITDRFPEILEWAAALPDGTVLDGEILAWEPGAAAPLPFARLQPRIARKTLTRKILNDSPVVFMAYDLLEAHGEDRRHQPQYERRQQLEALLTPLLDTGSTSTSAPMLSPLIDATDWTDLAAARASSRERGIEGLMLKHRDAGYGVGRTRASGEWWKWKIDPYTVDAVLLYAQHGHGRRANLYTDYTFAVWNAAPGTPERMLVPFTKAYSGLTDEEIRRVDAIVRKTTIEKFGPVRSVKPTLLFEIAFEGIARSPRHKSGIAVRFPRMLRWRLDKPIDEADTLDTLAALLDPAQ